MQKYQKSTMFYWLDQKLTKKIKIDQTDFVFSAGSPTFALTCENILA